jgi:hypothetical protein
MTLKIVAYVWILALISEINAGPYAFRTVNGKNELVIDEDYLESKKEMEIRKMKEAELKRLKKRRKNRARRLARKKRRKRRLKSNQSASEMMTLCIII